MWTYYNTADLDDNSLLVPTCVLHVGDVALMAKAEDDWTTQQGKDRDEKVDNDGEESGCDQQDTCSDHYEEQEWVGYIIQNLWPGGIMYYF